MEKLYDLWNSLTRWPEITGQRFSLWNVQGVVLAGFFLLAMANPAKGQYSGGNGTESEPYEIATTDDLIKLSDTPGDWGAAFIQTADIAFDEDETQVDWNGDGTIDSEDDGGFSPIGDGTNKFTGDYQGELYTIDNLFINRPTYYIGFFGAMAGAATVEGLGLTNVSISGRGLVGGFAGDIDEAEVGGNAISAPYIVGCYVTGSVTGTDGAVGGFAGFIRHAELVSACYAEVEVESSANNAIGGFAGEVGFADIEYCYSTGNVDITGTDNLINRRIGGFTGYLKGGEIRNSYSRGDVILTPEALTETDGVSGFVGEVGEMGSSYDPPVIKNCYSTGKPGKYLGLASGSGFVDWISTIASTDIRSFWDVETSTVGEPNRPASYAKGLSTADMQTQSTFTDEDWAFLPNGPWSMDSPTDPVNDGYPILWYQLVPKYSGGSGTIDNPYRIGKPEDLIELSNTTGDWGAYFIQIADIAFDEDETQVDWDGPDLDGDGTAGFSPIGNDTLSFTGMYDGDGYTISNLFIYRPETDGVGLFGFAGGAGSLSVQKLGLIDVDITGGYNVGGLAGRSSGDFTIALCYTTGSVEGVEDSAVGGLVGLNLNNALITNCYSRASVKGSSYLGGLVGVSVSNSKIEDSYSTGLVSVTPTGSGDNVGGLVGLVSSSQVTNSFWDTQTTSQATGNEGTGKTTVEMTYYTTFYSAGWDFEDETTNGDYDHWGRNLVDNDGYPFLSWEGFDHEVYPGLWIGAEDTDWHNPANWDDGQVPVSDVDVVIPETVKNPIVDKGATCRSITIKSGGDLTINSGESLELNGDFTLEEGGNAVNNGTLRFTGNSLHRFKDLRGQKSNLGNVEIGSSTVIL